jgi:hypothetical protein
VGWFSEGICESICISCKVCGLKSNLPCSDVIGLKRQLFKLGGEGSENSGLSQERRQKIYFFHRKSEPIYNFKVIQAFKLVFNFLGIVPLGHLLVWHFFPWCLEVFQLSFNRYHSIEDHYLEAFKYQYYLKLPYCFSFMSLFCLLQVESVIIPKICKELLLYQYIFSIRIINIELPSWHSSKWCHLGFCFKDPISNSKNTISQICSY